MRFTTYNRSLNTGLDYALNRHYAPQEVKGFDYELR